MEKKTPKQYRVFIYRYMALCHYRLSYYVHHPFSCIYRVSMAAAFSWSHVNELVFDADYPAVFNQV